MCKSNKESFHVLSYNSLDPSAVLDGWSRKFKLRKLGSEKVTYVASELYLFTAYKGHYIVKILLN